MWEYPLGYPHQARISLAACARLAQDTRSSQNRRYTRPQGKEPSEKREAGTDMPASWLGWGTRNAFVIYSNHGRWMELHPLSTQTKRWLVDETEVRKPARSQLSHDASPDAGGWRSSIMKGAAGNRRAAGFHLSSKPPCLSLSSP